MIKINNKRYFITVNDLSLFICLFSFPLSAAVYKRDNNPSVLFDFLVRVINSNESCVGPLLNERTKRSNFDADKLALTSYEWV